MTDENVSKVTSLGHLARRLLPALPLFITLFAGIDEAKAACAPAAPVTDSIVTCTGATLNQNDPFGYGDNQNARNIINVDPGASVTGTNIGVVLSGGGFANADTVNNFGTISGAFEGIAGTSGIVNNNAGATILGTGANGIGYLINSTGTLTNSGTISGTLRGVQIQNGTVTNTSSGTIAGGTIGVTLEDEGLVSHNPSLTNAGTITGGTIGVRFRGVSSFSGDLTNSGTISATGPSGIGVTFGTSGTVANSGTIEAKGGGASGIQADTTVTVDNTGAILGGANGAFAIGIRAGTVNLNNSGSVSAGDFGIRASNAANIINSGTIVGQVTTGIAAVGTASVFNSGTVVGGNNGVNATDAVVNNSGLISGRNAIFVTNAARVTNSGNISGTFEGVFAGASLQVTNSGNISAGNVAVIADVVRVSNSGTLSANTGISAFRASIITNSGTVIGTAGTAIKLGPEGDTLTLLQGSRIVGLIDMGGGADTININTVFPVSRVSSLTTLLLADTILPNVINFTGTVNAMTVNTAPNMPSVVSQTQFATLDPTAFGQADRVLMNFTGGISSLVQGRLGGSAASGSAVQVVSFAPTDARGRAEEAFAAMSATGDASGSLSLIPSPMPTRPTMCGPAASAARARRRATTPCCAPSPRPAPG